MRIFSIKSLPFAAWFALLLWASGCAGLTGQTAGEYVDDAAITTAVKAKLVADNAANLTRVDVDTTNRVVSLIGVVESSQEKSRAEQLALQVGGVRRVDNRLQIQSRN